VAYGRSQETRLTTLQLSAILSAAGFVDFQLIGRWDSAKGTQGYFASRPDSAVLAFRGTEPDDWTKLLTDFSAAQSRPSDTTHNGALSNSAPLQDRHPRKCAKTYPL
jgi:hypothetical protein